ncbi:MAG TPA: citrate synthase [Dongiaceae bacterium]|nr:citrate synthase [Dongiaceae bacterium]
MAQTASSGLEDVVAAETVLSEVDGANGRLIIRGHALAELAGRARFEELIALLFQDFFADLPEVGEIARRLGAARRAVFPLCRSIPAGLAPVDAVQAALAQLPDGDDLATAFRLLAVPAVMVPLQRRRAAGLDAIAPDAARGHAADILAMLRGAATAAEAQALDTYLVTVADHGLNASTFAARVVASTRAGLKSSTLAGLGALKGPLHGGAPGPVIEMLDAIGAAGNAEAWLDAAFARGERIMGFGHRIYRVRDPRADALKAALRRLIPAGSGRSARLLLAEAVEQAALDVLHRRKPGRVLETNVEFYTALLLEALGFAPADFTAVFAMGRTAGWIAHAREQALTGRLIRPQSRYVGPEPAAAA